jgi:hypothetical protein
MGQSTVGAHDQYAGEQLQNLQKRICLIEFLRLGFVVVCQGGESSPPEIHPAFAGLIYGGIGGRFETFATQLLGSKTSRFCK